MPLRGEARDHPAYTDLRPIRSGTELLVTTARHRGFALRCAQKSYQPPGRDDAVAFNEPRLLRELDHPHIVGIIDAQPDPERPGWVTIVMPEYVGGDLAAVINDGRRLSVGRVIEWGTQLASALDYLHTTKGYLQRDIKPDNVVIDSDGNVFVCDFGSAAEMSRTGHTAAVRATLPYQPPEVARHGWMTAKSDVYSLGLTLIELLDRCFLYGGMRAEKLDARLAQGRRAFVDRVLGSRARAPHVPSALRTILTSCVSADLDRRATAAELVTALEQLRVTDWCHVAGDGLDGEWTGRWPTRARDDRSVTLRVTSRVVGRGSQAGQREYRADYRNATSGGWRTIGSSISPAYANPHDSAAASQFFKDVDARVAHRFPS